MNTVFMEGFLHNFPPKLIFDCLSEINLELNRLSIKLVFIIN